VLAADSVVAAVTSGRLRPLLLTGVWVGLAFQAKMIEAWLVLPALAVCYLVAADGDWPQRARRCGVMVLIAVGVSLSWISLVSIWPSGARPYIDGSTDNSAFQQVFVYNGFGRLDQASPNQLVDRTIRLGIPNSAPPSWDRLLTGELGRDAAWLLAVAIVTLAAGLAARRRAPRTDLIRAGLLLWGIWLITLFVAFSATTTINTYYTAALSPAVAAVLAIGLVVAWRQRQRAGTWLAIGVAVLGTTAYTDWLLPAQGTGLPAWLRPALIGLAAAACCLAAAAALRRTAALAAISVAVAAAATLIVPAVAATTMVTSALGPFDTPFQPARETTSISAFFAAGFEIKTALKELEKANAAPYLMATQTAALAAPFIWASGEEVLPIGGFTGTMPEPTLARLKQLVKTYYVHTFLQSPTTTDPRLVWVAQHCIDVRQRSGPKPVLPIAVYFCIG
jgi:4-amino-4-deoxy-L-arabinose transferase-like glycosyltransferase